MRLPPPWFEYSSPRARTRDTSAPQTAPIPFPALQACRRRTPTALQGSNPPPQQRWIWRRMPPASFRIWRVGTACRRQSLPRGDCRPPSLQHRRLLFTAIMAPKWISKLTVCSDFTLGGGVQ